MGKHIEDYRANKISLQYAIRLLDSLGMCESIMNSDRVFS